MTKKLGLISQITVRARPGKPQQGILRYGNLAVRCALGRSGIASIKCEGDGATPLSTMRLCSGYLKPRYDGRFHSRLHLKVTRPSDGWCDDPADRNYNRPVRLPYAASAEKMLRDDELYDVCVVLDWNMSQRKRKCGSAIFLHIAKPGYPPTEGCIAISPRDMARLLPLVGTSTRLRVRRN